MLFRDLAFDRLHPFIKPQSICVIAFVAAAVLLFGTAPVRAEKAFFMELTPNSPGGGAYDVSWDGRVVVGTTQETGLFRWTRETGIVSLGGGNFIGGVSGDGSTIVGGDNPDANVAFRWKQQSGFQFIGPGNARAASYDGSVVVGGFGRWEEATGQVSLGFGALDVSADGKIMVGDTGGRAFRWTQETGAVELGILPPGYSESRALGMNPDGSVVVGYFRSSSNETEAARWTETTGWLGLGDLIGGGFGSQAADVSADGSIIVGQGREASAPEGRGFEAIIWDAAHGMRNLTDVLRDDYGLGASMNGFSLFSAEAISADGLTIVGRGSHSPGPIHPWIAYLGTPVPEPSTFVLAAVGLGALIACASRRRSSDSNGNSGVAGNERMH